MITPAPGASANPGAEDTPLEEAEPRYIPLRAKATALLTAATASGIAIGQWEAHSGSQVWPMMLGFVGASGLFAWAAQSWLARPIDVLAHQLDVMGKAARPSDLKSLPTDRGDEVGKIARAVQRIGINAVRNHQQAKALRQTLQGKVAVQSNQTIRELKQLAFRDALTELGNRRFLDDNLEQLVKLSIASHTDLACVLIDVDKFKEVNDQLGHAAGDELIALLGGLIRASVRHDDLTIRLGGDEFVLLLPGAAMPRVEALTEGLRKLLRQQVKVKFANGPQPDLSIGIASLIADRCDTGEKLLAVADARLYEAKRQGRGRTIGLGDQPVNVQVGVPLSLAV